MLLEKYSKFCDYISKHEITFGKVTEFKLVKYDIHFLSLRDTGMNEIATNEIIGVNIEDFKVLVVEVSNERGILFDGEVH